MTLHPLISCRNIAADALFVALSENADIRRTMAPAFARGRAPQKTTVYLWPEPLTEDIETRGAILLTGAIQTAFHLPSERLDDAVTTAAFEVIMNALPAVRRADYSPAGAQWERSERDLADDSDALRNTGQLVISVLHYFRWLEDR